MKDGKCWTLQDSVLIGKTLTTEDSDIDTGTFVLPNDDSFHREIDYNAAYRNPSTGYVYYSWFAATAGSGTINTPGETDASNSICPKSFRLPSRSDLEILKKSYNNLFSPPFNLIKNGYDGRESVGSIERHWTATKSSYYNHTNNINQWAYSIYDYVDGKDTIGLGGGIRCVAK